MSRQIRNIKKGIGILIKNGIPHIVGSSVINYGLSFLLNIVIVRFMSQNDFGNFSYAYNIVSFVLIFSGFGIDAGILQFCSETAEDRRERLWFGYIYGTVINVALALILFIYSIIGRMALPGSREILCLFSLWPVVFFTYTYFCIGLRATKKNQDFARVTNLNSFIRTLSGISLTVSFGVSGYVYSFYLAAIAASLYIIYKYRKKLRGIFCLTKFEIGKHIELMKYSLICMANNGLSQLLLIIDVQLIGSLMNSPEDVAIYKASTQIPNNMFFITSSVMVAVYPYFARMKDHKEWIKKYTKILIAGLSAINLPIGLLMIFASHEIISVIYGADYLTAVPIFQALGLSYIFSTVMRIPFGNILSMMRKVKINFWNSLISGIVNIILDIIFIKRIGPLGAAYATLGVVIVSSLISIIFYYKSIKVKI